MKGPRSILLGFAVGALLLPIVAGLLLFSLMESVSSLEPSQRIMYFLLEAGAVHLFVMLPAAVMRRPEGAFPFAIATVLLLGPGILILLVPAFAFFLSLSPPGTGSDVNMVTVHIEGSLLWLGVNFFSAISGAFLSFWLFRNRDN